ncbi:PDZ domain-containing protein [Phycicoccus sp. M110.8]|uniref:YlbL family protein n=1 Tax=Phycicoccus sp. M110.8 TaxID=3075433 RepID=UPI0028FDC08E|nr:PDZ domain-containing protein [Phycicoccus sp. M110.8]MDU0314781.1 PDZ domain-containing protein [Phycicoccus sp. M110.8]
MTLSSTSSPPPAGPEGPQGPQDGDGQDPYRLGRRSVVVLVGGFVLIALAALSTMVGLPYVVLKPGPVTNIIAAGKTPLITVSGARTYPTEGALDFTTVRVAGGPGFRVTVWDLLGAALNRSEEIEPEEAYFPKGITDKQVQEEGAAEMADSQQEAIAVALRAVGQKVVQHVVIAQVTQDSPNRSVLRPGDEIVSVDGTAVDDSASIRTAIGNHSAGQPVKLGLVRGGKPVDVTATTRDAGGRTTIGVFLGVRFDFPFTVKIDAGNVGGPSAGTMFALGLYDTLTPGALTGGAKIAGTGTIDSTGAVGPIGGIRQKLVGARDGGAQWFLAPADNCNEVVGHVPDGLRVVRISTFDQARSSVEAIAAHRGGSLPTCTK